MSPHLWPASYGLNATWSAQSAPSQTKDAFEMGKEHLDLLAPPLGSLSDRRGRTLTDIRCNSSI